ncbi:hypothetical protein Tco_0394424 [Tanacetum coccineum]
MVAFLEKPVECEGFEQIVDFLNAHTIKYALTVNPTIYTSCIEQFWATAKAKTVNGEEQLQALVDKKKVIITESTIRIDLHLEDAEGIDCLPNAVFFEELTRMGYEKLSQKLTFYKAFFSPQWKFLIHTILQCLSAKTTAWNEFSSTMASAIICLATNQKFKFSKYIFDNMVKNVDSVKKQPRRKQRKDNEVPQPSGPIEPIADEDPNEENVPTHSNDPLLSGEDRLKLNELIELYTNLQKKVLDLENTKTTQALEIKSLKRRVKKLEKKKKSRTHRLRRLYKVGLSAKIISSEDESFGEEDSSKQGRINAIDADEDIYLVNVPRDEDMFGVNNLEGDEVVVESDVVAKKKDDEVKVVKEVVSTTGDAAPVSTATITTVELTLAQTLAELKRILHQEPSETRTTTTPAIPSKVQDKAEFDEEERIAREKFEANATLTKEWDNVKAMIDTDYQMAL